MFDSLYGPQMSASAQRLEQSAAVVRRRASILASAAANCTWDGAGAAAFGLRSDETVARLRRGAARLDDAAAALRRHGARVEAALAVRAQEQARAAHELLQRGEHLVEQIGDVLHDVGVLR